MTALRAAAASAALVATAAFGVGCTPTPPPDDESQVACEIERETIETALEAWRADAGGGQYPATLGELDGVFIKPGSIDLDWIYGSDGVSFLLFGPC